MSITYFLGANSSQGFYSLYDGFPPSRTGMLHIIKGGPGTGKSSFMKKLAEAAESRGLRAEKVLCSGDPDSLDGLYLPELGEAWVDGTAPHVREPVSFGVDSDYVNLGSFCRLPMSPADKERAEGLGREYKAVYARAYACLAAAARLREASLTEVLGTAELAVIQKRVRGILSRSPGIPRGGEGSESRVFLSALSCKGQIRLSHTLSELCSLIYELDDGFGSGAAALELIRSEALERGADIICCPDPLRPEALEAVLLPEASLGFAAGDWGLDRSRHMRIDALVSSDRAREPRRLRRRYSAMEKSAMDAALEELALAKGLHDRLEQVYRPYMDHPSLDAFATNEITRLLG